jgi:hypothetical protein
MHVVQLGWRRMAGHSASFVANPIENSLTQVRLKGAFVVRLEAIEPTQRIEQRVLNEILCVEGPTRPGGQAAASPTAERRKRTLKEEIDGSRVTGSCPP